MQGRRQSSLARNNRVARGLSMKLSNARRLNGATALAIVAFGLSAFTTSFAMTGDGPVAFNIPAENTAQALDDFAKQAGVQILFPYEVAQKFSSPVLKGEFTRQEALARLLADSGLEIATKSDSTISLRVKERREQAASEEPTEVIVTGTHIRGGNPTSPVHVLTRTDIDESGYSQIGDLVRSLPENFSGGQNPGIIGATATVSGNGNVSSGSTVNLRGLGTDATLVLLNGHRLSADSFHQGADISGIPLAAVQRVEIVPDGASALYGSDAVAGVANFILRKNYSGTEVTGRVGTTAEGGGGESLVSVMSGKNGNNWFVLGNYERSHQEAITASQRKYTSRAPADETLLPSIDRTSFFLTGGWSPSDAVYVSMDALLSDRYAQQVFHASPTATVYKDATATPAYTLSLMADVDLAGDWRLHLVGVDASSRNSDHSTSPTSVTLTHYHNQTKYAEASTDGTILVLPSGRVKAAFGLGRRDEAYAYGDPGKASYLTASRTVDYAFAEASIPLAPASPSRAGLEELELDLSGRSEHYSEFGTASMPRLGLRYVPFSGMTIRASWGKSFKAPSFTQVYSPLILYYFPASLLGGGSGTALETYGGNPDLKPERSTAWTFGGEYAASNFGGLKLGATYFHIDYRDRVIQPISNLASALSDPQFAPFINRSPTASDLSNLVESASKFYNFSGSPYDPTTVSAVIQERYGNATSQTAHGLDVSYRQSFGFRGGTLSSFANGTWLTLNQKPLSTLPAQTLSGFIFYAPKFKARGGLSWSKNRVSATAIMNYISSEIDNGVTPNIGVASWTTVDTSLAFAFPKSDDVLGGVRLSFSALNLFNKAPPHTISPTTYVGLNYDSTNASIIGRFISLNLTKAW